MNYHHMWKPALLSSIIWGTWQILKTKLMIIKPYVSTASRNTVYVWKLVDIVCLSCIKTTAILINHNHHLKTGDAYHIVEASRQHRSNTCPRLPQSYNEICSIITLDIPRLHQHQQNHFLVGSLELPTSQTKEIMEYENEKWQCSKLLAPTLSLKHPVLWNNSIPKTMKLHFFFFYHWCWVKHHSHMKPPKFKSITM